MIMKKDMPITVEIISNDPSDLEKGEKRSMSGGSPFLALSSLCGKV